LSFLFEFFSDAIAFEKRFMLPIGIAATVDNIINEAIKKSPIVVADLCMLITNDSNYI
jgi:hypothetical protein